MSKITSALGDLFRAYEDGTMDKFYKTLGMFVATFSYLEAEVQSALWHLSGVERRTAQAILSGVRTEGAISYITRITDAQNWPQKRKDEFKIIGDRLGVINKLRNDILHYGVTWAGSNTWTVSNKLVIHVDDRLREFPISISALESAISDMGKINAHLVLLAWGETMGVSEQSQYQIICERAWLYKPPQQVEKARKSPKTHRARRRPPESSRA